MCSVSWRLDEQGYQVFFNRDEQKSRALALPPQQLSLDQVDVLMPIDPVGQGSWISTNEFGLSLCLLNNYQGQLPSGRLTSRGLLLKQLSCANNLGTLRERFNKINLNHFAPFILLAFAPDLTQSNPDVWSYEWDGEALQIKLTQAPRFSSGVDLPRVVAYREQAYALCGGSTQDHIDFHRHHHSTESHLSVCMHRQDAHTVSFTQISVTKGQQRMHYVAGSPCGCLNESSLVKNTYQILKPTALVS